MVVEVGVFYEEVKIGLVVMLLGFVDKLIFGGLILGVDQLGGLLKGFDISKILGS